MTEMHRRPSEHQLPSELKGMRALLFRGFDSRDAVVRWFQQLAIRTLGQVPSEVYREFAEEFKPDDRAEEGVVLASFLNRDARTRDMDQKTAVGLREQWAATYLAEMSESAFRSLRKDAGEFVGSNDSGEEPPDLDDVDIEDQPFAFRPALEDLDTYQRVSLQRFLNVELQYRRDILNWSDELIQATRSEKIEHNDTRSFVRRLYNDPVGDLIISSTDKKWHRVRQVIAAKYILPAFNRAVQDLATRTGEEVSYSNSTMDDKPGAWRGDNA